MKPILSVFNATEEEILEYLKEADRMANESLAPAKLRIEEDVLNIRSGKGGMLNYDLVIEQENQKKSDSHLKME